MEMRRQATHLLADDKTKQNDRDQAHTKRENPEAAGRSSATPKEEKDWVLQSGGQSCHTSRPAGRVGLWVQCTEKDRFGNASPSWTAAASSSRPKARSRT